MASLPIPNLPRGTSRSQTSATPPGMASLAGRAGLRPRPAAERFHSQRGWLDSWHSFSFAGHDDPDWRGFGPLLVINDDRIDAGQGFGMHPHRDMEIITVMVEGILNHRDSMGHGASLRAGEVQRMGAGSGIIHSEMNGGSEPCRLLQIWIQPSHRGNRPSYGQKAFPPSEGWTLLVDPAGAAGALSIDRPVRLWRAQPGAGQGLSWPVAAAAQAWIQMIAGDLTAVLGPEAAAVRAPLQAGDGLGLGAGMAPALSAGSQGADLLVFELR